MFACRQTRHSLPPEDSGGYSSSDGDVSKVRYFFDIPAMFRIKSLYSNDLILNIASKSKKAVQKLKFLDSPSLSNNVHGCALFDECSFSAAENKFLVQPTSPKYAKR